jgi:putative MATE family efflux protein
VKRRKTYQKEEFMSQNANSFLGTEKISVLMRKYAIPCIISLLVAALYNIVDQIFIANASYLGSYGNAANTVVFPLTVVALAIAVMVGDGCCAFVSLALGKKKSEEASKSVGNAIVLSVVSSLILTIIYLLFANTIIALFGGTVNEQTFTCCKEYFFWISLGIPFYMFGQAMNPIIRADGSPNFAMTATLAGAFINIILDPLFIFVFKWGMMGAALATILGQIFTAVLSVWYIAHPKILFLHKEDFKLDLSICLRSLQLGICSFLSQISLVASMAAINNMIRKYGALDPIFSQAQYAQIPMAVVGIVMKFFQIVISIVVGMAAGCIPIVGYNLGSGLNERISKLFKLLLCLEGLVGLVAFIIVEGFPRQLISIFGASNESIYYTQFAEKAFRIYLCMIILACINKATFIFLQAMGKALESTLLSMVREIVFGVGFALLLPYFFGLDGVLYSMPVSDLLTGIIALALIIKTFKQLRVAKTKNSVQLAANKA